MFLRAQRGVRARNCFKSHWNGRILVCEKMGAFLSEPKTEKTAIASSNSRLSYGVSCMQGWRISMEVSTASRFCKPSFIKRVILVRTFLKDAHTCLLDFDGDSSLFAVYDGHGGKLSFFLMGSPSFRSEDPVCTHGISHKYRIIVPISPV